MKLQQAFSRDLTTDLFALPLPVPLPEHIQEWNQVERADALHASRDIQAIESNCKDFTHSLFYTGVSRNVGRQERMLADMKSHTSQDCVVNFLKVVQDVLSEDNNNGRMDEAWSSIGSNEEPGLSSPDDFESALVTMTVTTLLYVKIPSWCKKWPELVGLYRNSLKFWVPLVTELQILSAALKCKVVPNDVAQGVLVVHGLEYSSLGVGVAGEQFL
ncbi:hypothetical protein M427DRAFT_49363, partial [Gonapodya prolifera JEL478]